MKIVVDYMHGAVSGILEEILDNKENCRDYFVNEIEYVPNLFPEYNTHVDVLKRVGDSIIKKSKDLKKKKLY